MGPDPEPGVVISIPIEIMGLMWFGRYPIDALPDGAVDRWRDLAARAAEPNPFVESLFALPAFEHRGGGAVQLLVSGQGDRWDACMLVRPQRTWRGIPLPNLEAWSHRYCFLDSPLLARENPTDALVTLLRGALDEPQVAFLSLYQLGLDDRVGQAFREACAALGTRAITYEHWARATLRRRPEPDYLLETMSANRRKSLRRQRRGLERELGGPFVTVDHSQDPDAPGRFIALEAAGWKGRVGTALASNPRDAAFFVDLCERFRAEDRLQVLSLEVDGTCAATQVNLFAGDVLFGFKVAFDERFARYGPGVLLEVDAIDIFHHRTESPWADSCAGPRDALMNRLWPDRRAIGTVVVPAPGTLGRVAGQLVPASRRMRRAHERARGLRIAKRTRLSATTE